MLFLQDALELSTSVDAPIRLFGHADGYPLAVSLARCANVCLARARTRAPELLEVIE
jgi:hypothetical protein